MTFPTGWDYSHRAPIYAVSLKLSYLAVLKQHCKSKTKKTQYILITDRSFNAMFQMFVYNWCMCKSMPMLHPKSKMGYNHRHISRYFCSRGSFQQALICRFISPTAGLYIFTISHPLFLIFPIKKKEPHKINKKIYNNSQQNWANTHLMLDQPN